MTRARARGFTLIELMVTIVILAILVVLGFPSYEQWIRNTRIRNAAESIQNGLRLARNEATQRGANVEFDFTTAGTADWAVCQLPPASSTPIDCTVNTPIQAFVAKAGAGTVQVFNSSALSDLTPPYSTALTSTSAGNVIFTALGRPASGTNSLLRIDTTAATTSSDASRRLVITITAGGNVRMCDPAFGATSTNPQKCQ